MINRWQQKEGQANNKTESESAVGPSQTALIVLVVEIDPKLIGAIWVVMEGLYLMVVKGA